MSELEPEEHFAANVQANGGPPWEKTHEMYQMGYRERHDLGEPPIVIDYAALKESLIAECDARLGNGSRDIGFSAFPVFVNGVLRALILGSPPGAFKVINAPVRDRETDPPWYADPPPGMPITPGWRPEMTRGELSDIQYGRTHD